MPSDEEMERTLFGLLDNTDYAAAVTGASYAEYALEILLVARFRKLGREDHERMFDGAAGGILGTASAKIRLAYAIRLITETT